MTSEVETTVVRLSPRFKVIPLNKAEKTRLYSFDQEVQGSS